MTESVAEVLGIVIWCRVCERPAADRCFERYHLVTRAKVIALIDGEASE
jgi:hypothetical protein